MSGPDFHHLTPDRVLDAVEQYLDRRCSNVCRPMNSYINRVYEILPEEGEAVIAKFYRPARWSEEAIREEHTFIQDCLADELPIVAPLEGSDGETLGSLDGMLFTVFPKIGGRICDEPSPAQWQQLGRLIARMHQAGRKRESEHRIFLDDGYAERQVDLLLESELIPLHLESGFIEVAEPLLDEMTRVFEHTDFQRIHGDCHHQNVIYRPGERFYLIDFDDMAIGPPVQDIWMLLPGRIEDSRKELDAFLRGYQLFAPFQWKDLDCVEPLRALRMIHYTAWCARQVMDGGFSRLAPDWGTDEYWQRQIHDLQVQLQEIRDR